MISHDILKEKEENILCTYIHTQHLNHLRLLFPSFCLLCVCFFSSSPFFFFFFALRLFSFSPCLFFFFLFLVILVECCCVFRWEVVSIYRRGFNLVKKGNSILKIFRLTFFKTTYFWWQSYIFCPKISHIISEFYSNCYFY